MRQSGVVEAAWGLAVTIVLAGTPAAALDVPAGAVFFDQNTDAILVAGQTTLGTTATFEARAFFPTGVGAGGRVFDEWTDFAEDKLLYVGPSGAGGFAYSTGAILDYSATITSDAWHHFAFVHDGPNSEQRLYVDGIKVLAQAASGDINDGGDNGSGTGHPFLGAIFRDGGIQSSFIGFLDTLRISDNVRYSGDSFTAPTGDLADDANTVILFNFAANEVSFAQGVATVADASGNGHSGTLGAGFGGATFPRLPGTIDVDGNASLGPLTDGLLILRFLFGFTGSTLDGGAVGGSCGRCDGGAIRPYIATLGSLLDIDGDGALGALTDGLLVLRYLFGFTGDTLTTGAVGEGCSRCDASTMVPYLQSID